MNGRDNKTIPRKSDCSSPNCSEGNGYTMFKSNVGSIDEINFNEASLDALLNSENLNDESNPIQNTIMESDTIGLRTSQAPAPQLMATTSTAQEMVGTTSHQDMVFAPLPSIQYKLSASTQPSTTSSLSSYATYPYLQLSQQPSIAPATAPVPSLMQHQPMQHQPIAPALPAVRPIPEVKPLVASAFKRVRGQKSGTETVATKGRMVSSKKRCRDATAVSEDEEDKHKRRHGRNLREQQRSQKITRQIEHLRDVLAAANIAFKPDKYSTLVTVADYIKQLQAKSAALDGEHSKLLNTITKTNEMVNDQYLPASTNGRNPPGDVDLCGSGTGDGSETVFVRNIDYRSVFASCGVPLAVASIDGRLLDCNVEFEKVTGYSREELLPCEQSTVISADEARSSSAAGLPPSGGKQKTISNLSLFNLLSRDHMERVFLAMSKILKRPKVAGAAKPAAGDDLWVGDVVLGRHPDTKVGILCCW